MSVFGPNAEGRLCSCERLVAAIPERLILQKSSYHHSLLRTKKVRKQKLMAKMNPNIQLYTYALSPFGMKVYWALVYKRVDFALHYVSPKDQSQINFTHQRVVPVLKIDDEWRLDSGPICVWLDEQFPDRPIAGANARERSAIAKADSWVTDNVIGLLFRSTIDDDSPFSAFRNGRVLARVMRETSGGVPWWAQFIWYRLLRRTQFVVDDANKVNRSISLEDCRAEILRKLEGMLDPTGFVAGTDKPSYADITVFAQLACCSSFGFEGALAAVASPKLHAWYQGMCALVKPANAPSLAPGWKIYGVDVT